MRLKLFVLFLIFAFCLPIQADAKTKKISRKKKKEPIQKEKMVETKQEWEQKAQNVPLIERKLEPYQPPKSDEKIIMPEEHYIFELYNNPAGTRELNIEDVKKNLYSYPYIIADKKVNYAAYSRFYYLPNTNQISSEFYVEKLDTSKTKTQRILDFNHNQDNRTPILKSAMDKYYQNLFNGLTLVDWDKTSSKLLIKEKIGSTLNGIYKTNLYVYFMSDGVSIAKTKKIDILDNEIKRYYLEYNNINLSKYEYDYIPLGFNNQNNNEIIILVYTYDKFKNKIFLGKWGYDTTSDSAYLISETDSSASISSNGLILIKSLDY